MIARSRGADWLRRGLTLCLAMLSMLSLRLDAATVTAELQTATRAATFEVVLAKTENPAITYEKALPLELVPFQERNDKYWSIGTAFAIGPNTFISAAHVLVQGVGSLLGEPMLRAANGQVYALEQIQRYSADEDFIEFSLKSPPAVKPLQTNPNPQIDDEVFAVGNALGDGIVIRSGLYTSATPEDQDGRWKWIRFSAAASPGNSGGPLLDTQGRVIGIVIAKSENENLNYALPIKQVIDAPVRQARFDTRAQFQLPVLNQPITRTLKTQFALPKSFSAFANEVMRLNAEHYRQAMDALLKEQSATVFPRGKGVHRLLATQSAAWFPQLVMQNANDEWEAKAPEQIDKRDLPGEGFISSGTRESVTLLRVHRPNNASDAAFYSNSKALMDLILSGERISRQVGRESVRITSLGAAAIDAVHTDRLGRPWQLRTWNLSHIDSRLVMMLLPTPDGYVALMQFSTGSLLDNTYTQLKELSNYVSVSYWGTQAQWQTYMGLKTLLPMAMSSSQLNFQRAPAPSLQLQAKRLAVTVNAPAFPLSDQNKLGVIMQWLQDGDRLSFEPVGLELSSDDSNKTSLTMVRHLAPDADTGRESRTRWDSMMKMEAPYDSFPRYDSSEQQYWISTTLTPGGGNTRSLPIRNDAAQVRYLVSYRTRNLVSASEVSDTLRQVLSGTRILER